MTLSALPKNDSDDERDTEEPSRVLERKFTLLIELLTGKMISRASFCDRYGISERTFARDLSQLRVLGENVGLSIPGMRSGRVKMTDLAPRFAQLTQESEALKNLLYVAASAFGRPLLGNAEPVSFDTGTLRIVMPQLDRDSHVSTVCDRLRDACRRHARVRFKYASAGKGTAIEREVEPAFVLNRSGRYYLVAYDPVRSKDWRMFALDGISDDIAFSGTFQPRPIPETYDRIDAIGFIADSKKPPTAVTVRLAAVVAESAASRIWQRRQIVGRNPDGSADVTFYVTDAGEVVRWALGFGADAKIIAPQSAVALATTMTKAICALYESAQTAPG